MRPAVSIEQFGCCNIAVSGWEAAGKLGCARLFGAAPRQEFVNTVGGMVGDLRQHMGHGTSRLRGPPVQLGRVSTSK